jgi:hypothetical protein
MQLGSDHSICLLFIHIAMINSAVSALRGHFSHPKLGSNGSIEFLRTDFYQRKTASKGNKSTIFRAIYLCYLKILWSDPMKDHKGRKLERNYPIHLYHPTDPRRDAD